MTKTKIPLEEQVEGARKEYLSAVQKVADLEAEAGAIPGMLRDLPWEQGERAALDAVKDLEHRRQALPYMIRQARTQEAQSELNLLSLQLQEAEEKRPLLEQLVEDRQAEFEASRRALNSAKGEQSELIFGVMSDIRRARHAAKERLIAAESQDVTGESRGPLVRSAWQQSPPTAEDAIQDTPAAMHFGSAHVSDKPLSMEEETPATVVIPSAATKATKAPRG